ncbi:lipopolysaccharide biosynthesis protein [Tsuneonella sp. HG094]
MKFARQFLVYGIAGALSRLASFLLVPLYTRTLSQGDYGQLEILLALHQLAVLTIGLQGESAVARDYFRAEQEGRVRELYWGALGLAAAGLAISIGLVAAAFAIGIPDDVTRYIPLILFAGLVTHVLGIQLVAMRFASRPFAYGAISLVDVLVTAASSIYLIVFQGMGILGALAGLAIGKTVVLVAIWRSTFGKPQRPGRIREMAAYSLPTMPAVLLNWLQTMGSRIVWSFFFAVSAVAVASVSMRVAAAFGLLVYAFRLAWEPLAFRMLESEERRRFAPALAHICIVAFVAAGVASLAGPLLTALFAPPEYRAATGLVGILMMAQVWLAVILVTQIGIHGARVTSRVSVVFAIGAVLNLAVLAATAHFAGIVAMAWAQFAGATASALAAAWYSNRHFDTAFSPRLLAVMAAVTTGFGFASHALPSWEGSLWPHPLLVLSTMLGVVIIWLAGMDRRTRGELVADYRAVVAGGAVPFSRTDNVSASPETGK